MGSAALSAWSLAGLTAAELLLPRQHELWLLDISQCKEWGDR